MTNDKKEVMILLSRVAPVSFGKGTIGSKPAENNGIANDDGQNRVSLYWNSYDNVDLTSARLQTCLTIWCTSIDEITMLWLIGLLETGSSIIGCRSYACKAWPIQKL